MLLNDHESDFEKLLHINNDVRTLLIEIFKIKKRFAPPIMKSILKGRIIQR